jgi:hypothetical protein
LLGNRYLIGAANREVEQDLILWRADLFLATLERAEQVRADVRLGGSLGNPASAKRPSAYRSAASTVSRDRFLLARGRMPGAQDLVLDSTRASRNRE